MFTPDYLYLPVFSGILSRNVENAISSEKDHQTLWKYCVAYQVHFIYKLLQDAGCPFLWKRLSYSELIS